MGGAGEAGAREGGGAREGESPSLPPGPYRVVKKKATEVEEEATATTASRSIASKLESTFLFILENFTVTSLLFSFFFIRAYMIIHSFRSVAVVQ